MSRSFLLESAPSTVHSPFFPAEVREGDPIYVDLCTSTAPTTIRTRYRVWSISPLGIELVDAGEPALQPGANLHLDVQLGRQRASHLGQVVSTSFRADATRLAHIRFVAPTHMDRTNGDDRRAKARWYCHDIFYPTAVCANPVVFNDFLYFKIRDLSSGGVKLITSFRNKFLLPGMIFDCLVNFPMTSQVKMKLMVTSVRIETEGDKEELAVGATFSIDNSRIKSTIAQYLLQFGTVGSPEELRTEGLEVEKVGEAINFTYVRTEEEYNQVLQLRLLAYRKAGKVQDNKSAVDMGDEYDAKSRIVIGKFKGKIVCCARMTFHNFGEKLEQEKFVQWTNELPRPDEVVEIMRACTHPDFRGSDLLLAMFKRMAVMVAQAKRRWIVMCSTDEMLPFYHRIGFHQVGLSYDHTALNNVRHHVMVANFLDGMSGRTVGPIYWNLVWGDSVEYMDDYRLLDIDPFMRIRITIYRWFKPIASAFYLRRIAQRRRTKNS